MPRRKDPLDILLDAIFDAKTTGRYGERLTAKQLQQLARLPGGGKVLRNVYVPKKDGGTAEIDVLFITARGVFVIESKNYSGWIFGREEDRWWTQCLPGGEKNRFYNPVRQNRGHIKWLSRYLGGEVPLYPIVVFSERCELKKVTLTSPDTAVIKRDDLKWTVRRIWNSAVDAMPVDVEAVYKRLAPLTSLTALKKAEHVEEARAAARQGGHRPKATPAQEPGPPLCPRCGKPLVVRTAKRGPTAGQKFYGCSGYPNCRYTRGI